VFAFNLRRWILLGLGKLRMGLDISAATAADLIVGCIDAASAAGNGMRTGLSAVKHPITADASSVVVHHRSTASRVPPEHQILDFTATTDPCPLTISLITAT